MGIAMGIGIAAWNDLSVAPPPQEMTISTVLPTVDEPLRAFFPNLESAEATVEQIKVREIIRREAGRQQQLDQAREALAFNGATTEDIEAFFIQKLSTEAASSPPE